MNTKTGKSASSEEGSLLSQGQILSLINAIPDIVYFKDEARRNRIVNKAFVDAFGLSQEVVAGKTDEEILPPGLAEACRESDEFVLVSGKPYRFEEKSGGPDGIERDFETIKAPVFDETGRITGLVGVSRDITAQKTMKTTLAESEERFRGLFENSTIGLYRTTPDGRILLANPALLRMMGYASFEELSVRNLELEEDGFEHEYPRHLFKDRIDKEGEVRGLESAWKRKDGTTIYVRESARAIRDAAGRTLYYEGTVEDITERRLAEMDQKEKQQALETALAERNVLLKEIHHRVKNNMQVISSLLNLQSRYLKHPDDVDLFKESQNRIRSMAFIHEKLYQSKSLSRIEFGGYIRSLIDSLQRSYQKERSRVRVRMETEEVFLDIQTAIPCGLIINELVSNALKHAFPGERGGEVVVGLRCREDGAIQLNVRDDGVGLPLGFNIRATDSMGMQLVSMLVDQIDGTIEVERARGTEFRLTFRELKSKPRI
jgi:PAS domain S-box-containing protein